MTWVSEMRQRLLNRLPAYDRMSKALVDVAMDMTDERATPAETEAAVWSKIQQFLQQASHS